MNIQQLRYFVSVAETMNYSQSAEHLFISRQAVSRAIKSLEKEIGFNLFSVSRNKLKLTDKGVEFLHRCQPIVAAFDALVEDYPLSASAQKPLRIAMSYGLISYGLPIIFEAIESHYGSGDTVFRNSIADCSCKECHSKVVEETADIGFLFTMDRHVRGCLSVLLDSMRVGLVVCSDNSLYNHSKISINDLRNQKMVLLPDYDFIYRPMIVEARQNGFELRPSHEITEAHALERVIKGANAAAIDGLEKKRHYSSNIRIIPFENDQAFYTFAVYKNSSKRVLEIIDFINSISDYLTRELTPLEEPHLL